jgi:hypothetical protein
MSLTNYGDLASAVSSWTGRGDYSAGNISDFTTLFEAWANRTFRVRQMELSASLTPTNGVAALPSDYLQWRRLNWAGTYPRELEYVHPTILNGLHPTVLAIQPDLFTIEGSNIETRSSDTSTLTLEYWQKIPSLITNSTNWLMTASPDIYLSGVLLEAYLFNKDPDNAIIWKQRRDELGDEIKKLDKSSVGPGAVRVFGPTP